MNDTLSKLSRRRFLALSGAASVASSFAIVGRAKAAVELRLTHPADASHPVHLALERMVERVAERTDDEVAITIFADNALGSPVETAQQTRAGAIDMIAMNPVNIEGLSDTIGAVNIPYQFDDYAHAHRTLDETARDWLTEQLSNAGFTWVANFEWGFRALSNSRRPVNEPDDITGMRIRVPPELAIRAAFDALGAVTQTIAFQEVYLALANRTVDGQDNPIATTFAGRFHEVQNYITLTRHIYATILLASNPRVWENLTDDQRGVLAEEATRAGQEAREEVVANEEHYLEQMEEAGLEITRPDVAPFRDQMEPAYAELREALGDETWETWASFVEAARTS